MSDKKFTVCWVVLVQPAGAEAFHAAAKVPGRIWPWPPYESAEHDPLFELIEAQIKETNQPNTCTSCTKLARYLVDHSKILLFQGIRLGDSAVANEQFSISNPVGGF